MITLMDDNTYKILFNGLMVVGVLGGLVVGALIGGGFFNRRNK